LTSSVELGAFVPRPLLPAGTEGTHLVPAAILFADLAGYTTLAERLVHAGGRAGTETLLETIDALFTTLIDRIHEHGGEVLRFGGDALFVAFVGDRQRERAQRAVAAAVAMRASMQGWAPIDVGRRAVRLRQTIGIHDGLLAVHRWRGSWTEELVFGPDVTTVLDLEAQGRSGQIVLSPVAARAAAVAVRPLRADALVLAGERARCSIDRAALARVRPDRLLADAEAWLPPVLAQSIVRGIDAQHRPAAVAFIGVSRLDGMCQADPRRAGQVLTDVMDVLSAAPKGVAVLCTDVARDGVAMLVASGAVRSDGDDAERVLSVAQRLVRLDDPNAALVRAGVNAGLVFTAAIGHPTRKAVAALGDTTNTAHRLMSLAGPGEVLVTDALVRQLAGAVSVRWRGPTVVRGRRRAVDVGVVDPDAVVGVGPDEVAFAGRADEVRELVELIAARRPRLIEIVGPLGIGKSRIAAEASRRCPAAVTSVACQIGDGPFESVRRVLAALGAPGDLVDETVNAAAQVERPADIAREVATAAVADLVLDRRRDAVLVIDQADHMDAASRRVIERCLALGDAPAPIVLTQREPASLVEPAGVDAVRIAVGPLPAADMRAIVLAASTQPPSESHLRAVVNTASGNPGAAVRLARAGLTTELTADVAALVAADLDRIPQEALGVARAGALAGASFDESTVAAVAGVERARVGAACGLLGRLVSVSGDGWRFRDEIVRAGLLAATPVRIRRQLGRRLAIERERALTTSSAPSDLGSLTRVARAWLEAGDDVEIARWCGRAGRTAAAAGATDDAVELLAAAWRSASRVNTEGAVDLAVAWADAAAACGRAADVVTALAAATRRASPEQRVELLVRRVRVASRAGQIRSAAALLARARAALAGVPQRAHDHSRLLVELERLRVLLDRGRPASAAVAIDDVLQLAARIGETRDRAVALALAADIVAEAGGTAIEYGTAAYELAQQVGDPLLCGWIACNLGVTADNVGDWSVAAARYAAAERHFHEAGSLWSVALARLNQHSISIEIGDLERAEPEIAAAHRELTAAGLEPLALAAAAQLFRIAAQRGVDVAKSVESLSQSVAALRECGETEVALFRELALAEVLIAAGRVGVARSVLARSMKERAGYPERHLLRITARRIEATIAFALDELDAASAAIDDAWQLAARAGAVGEVCRCLNVAVRIDAARGRDPDGKREAALADLERELGVVSYPIVIRRGAGAHRDRRR
jgi:class 3 adenylate cyclase